MKIRWTAWVLELCGDHEAREYGKNQSAWPSKRQTISRLVRRTIFIDFPCLLFLFAEEKKNTYHERHMLLSSKLLVQENSYAFVPLLLVSMWMSVFDNATQYVWHTVMLYSTMKKHSLKEYTQNICTYRKSIWQTEHCAMCVHLSPSLLIDISLGRSWRCWRLNSYSWLACMWATQYCKIGWQSLNIRALRNGIDHNFQRFILGLNGLESSSINHQDPCSIEATKRWMNL